MVDCPRISVVIPCYKGARYLPEAIESCLRQTMSDFEVIVVDDASPDQCAEIAARYASQDKRVQLIKRPANGGVSAAFNTGFAAAKGAYHTRLAQDDTFTEDALASFCDFLAANPAVGLVYSDFQSIDETEKTVSHVCPPNNAERALLKGNRLGICVAWRREVWETIGEFHSEFDAAEDYEYWLRVWDRFPIQKLENKTLMRFRVHERMGSLVHCGRQERATLKALREQYPTNLPRIRRAFLRRAA
ncbi:MAG TPA: glycosyltransferase, partial [Tepidisphaeraceae bacterium]|nr:glycosyltransferase [Tepidisphaeraceae bacterium]